jgi:BolA protein
MPESTEINQQRMSKMRQLLEDSLSPSELLIQDDSHLHAGHAGSQSGLGHFTVKVKSEKFEGLLPLKRHQLVYQSLGDMMKTDIHALAIKAYS